MPSPDESRARLRKHLSTAGYGYVQAYLHAVPVSAFSDRTVAVMLDAFDKGRIGKICGDMIAIAYRDRDEMTALTLCRYASLIGDPSDGSARPGILTTVILDMIRYLEGDGYDASDEEVSHRIGTGHALLALARLPSADRNSGFDQWALTHSEVIELFAAFGERAVMLHRFILDRGMREVLDLDLLRALMLNGSDALSSGIL